MSDDPPAVADDHLDPLSSLPIPSSIFSDDLSFSDDILSFTFDDFSLPADADQFLNSEFDPHHDDLNDVVFDPSSGINNNLSDVSQFLNFPLSPVDHVNDEIMENIDNNNNDSNYININDNDSNSNKNDNSDLVSPQFPVSSSQGSGSGNCGSDRTEGGGDVNCDSCGSPESGNSVVEQKVVKKELLLGSNFVLKRKIDENLECRTNKCRKSNEMTGTNETTMSGMENLDEKKKARLIRNRESAQLSRQRKKHYVEELEDKVRMMHSTIQDLNARISYFAAENATLKQQMVAGGGGVGVGGVGMPNLMYPPHPGMGPIGYPWMPCPPYVVKSQGSQVPLVPIPRLKPQQQSGVLSSLEKAKKVDVKRSGSGVKSKVKTKKVASVSFVGLLLFVLMFGGLVPMMNVKFGEKSGMTSDGYKFYDRGYPGRVLMGDEHVNGSNHRAGVGKGRGREDNGSEPLVASLYVPRNDKLVKIDGNLIIHSVLASEKAMANKEKLGMTKKEDSGLAGALDLVPAISVPAVGRNGGRQPHMYRTSSERQKALSSDKENLKSKPADGKLQQWFREGLAGPMLSSGMCTEVFQFDVSTAIIPATSVVNITAENHHNSTYISTVKNRRILHGLAIPLPSSTTNITKEQVSSHDSKHEDLHKNSNVSSMVVSVLFDPREAGDGGDVEGMMGGKSFSRIFVVVLLDSVKYVTYSCMLPLKGGSHLVAA